MTGCLHFEPGEVSYNDVFDDADRRTESGDVQVLCSSCGRYVWRSFYPASPPASPVSREGDGA